jgi:hypothetical protein
MTNRNRIVGGAAWLALLATPARADEGTRPAEPVAIASHRVELRPQVGWALWPHSLSGGSLGAAASYRFSPAFAMGLNAAWYSPLDASAGATPSYPLNESDWSASLDFAFFPIVARRRGGDESGAFEAYALGAAGIVRTRPVPVRDPTDRAYFYNNNVDLAVGIGARLYASRLLAVTLELRDLMYFERLENPRVPAAAATPLGPTDPSTFYDAGTHFTQVLQVCLGGTFLVGAQ